MPCFEYDPKNTALRLGEIVLTDQTHKKANHRSPFAFKIKGSLYLVDADSNTETRSSDAISLRIDGESYALEAGYASVQNRHFLFPGIQIILDMSKLPPIYKETNFHLDIRVLIKENGDFEEYGKFSESFLIHENRREAFLCLQLSERGGAEYKNLDISGGECDIDVRRNPIIKQAEGEETIVSLRLKNSVGVANNDSDHLSNDIKITGISYEPMANTNKQYLDQLLKIHITDDRGITHPYPLRENTPLQIMPDERSEFIIKLSASSDVDEKYFWENRQDKEYGLILTVAYIAGGENKSLLLNICFKLKPDLGRAVLGVDFGTSAISMAYNEIIEEEHHKINPLPLGNRWKEKNKGDTPLEDSDQVIDSTVLFSPINAPNYKVPVSQAEFFMPRAEDELISYLKSYIGACQKTILPNNSNPGASEISTKKAVKEIYTLLYKDYGDLASSDNFSRLVITHPNSYFKGQIDFLQIAIMEAMGNIKEISAISESDAVIYAYLRDENMVRKTDAFSRRYTPSDEAGPHVFEHILCLDMGAGTTDISYRKIQYNVKNNAVYLNPGSGGQHELLGMVSVNGAGNALDKAIATVIDGQLSELQAYLNSLSKEEDEKYLIIPSLRALNEDEMEKFKLSKQKDHLRILQEIKLLIGQAKKNAKEDSTDLEIAIKLPEAGGGVSVSPFIYTDIDKFKGYVKTFEQNSEIKFDFDNAPQDHVIMKIPMGIIENQLAADFFPSQITRPLEIVLSTGNNEAARVDTVLITGRGVLFPPVLNFIKKELDEKYGNPTIINCGDNNKMKSLVVEGACLWGVENVNGKALFSPPIMTGALAILWREGQRAWHGKILLHKSAIEEYDSWRQKPNGEEVKRPEGRIDLTTGFCDELMFVHTQLNSDILLQKVISDFQADISNLDQGGNFRISDKKNILENIGYFHVLRTVPDLLRYSGGRAEDVPILVRLIFPGEDGYGATDPDGDFQNLHLDITIGARTIEEIVGGHGAITKHQFWPYSIFNKMETL